MFDFDLSTILAGIILLVLILLFQKYKRKKSNVYLLFFSVFYIYILFVFKYTIFPIPISPILIQDLKDFYTVNNLNFIPLDFESGYWRDNQIILNIVISIPFGFGLSYVAKIRKKSILLYGISFGIFIEGLQGLISVLLGFTYRTIDVNDVIFNFLGVVLGFIIFRLFSYVFLKAITNTNHHSNSIIQYMYLVQKNNFK